MPYMNGNQIMGIGSVIINEMSEEEINSIYEAGQKAEYDAFWDNAQDYGKPKDYQFAFGGSIWTYKNFKPKYDLKVTNGRFMFVNSYIQNLKEILTSCGVSLDTKDCLHCNKMFYLSLITEVPTLDLRKAINLNELCYEAKNLYTISLMIGDGNQTFTNSFYKAESLRNIGFLEGVIGQDIDFSNCRYLSPLSRYNIISFLKDFRGTTTTHTLAFHADVKEKLTDSEKAAATQKGWTIF